MHILTGLAPALYTGMSNCPLDFHAWMCNSISEFTGLKQTGWTHPVKPAFVILSMPVKDNFIL